MNKTDLVKATANKIDFTIKDTEVFVDGFFKVIAEALQNGEKIKIPNHGVYEVKDRAARKGRNRITGEIMDIPATRKPVWTPSKNLVDLFK